MVAKITTPGHLLKALYYNENKVTNGKAVCLHAGGFLRDANEMTVNQKAKGFERLNERNERAKTKTLHISLNFDPSEKLTDAQLKEIAAAYLKGIGFEGQPYLVYRHNDAGHPHIHIVTTTIKEDGSRINTHNIGRNQSEKTRKELEKQFGLVKAGGRKTIKQDLPPRIGTGLQYGKTETHKAITQVISSVIKNYLFSSLPELNAVLRKYGVQADPGTETSRVYKHRGLNFRMLDANGKPVGVPIKASSIPGKPTLDRLEKLFDENKLKKDPFKTVIKNAVEDALLSKPGNLQDLKKILAAKNIDLVLRQAPDGRTYGVTFIDENNRVVINGSDLGKAYSAAHLQIRLSANTSKDSQSNDFGHAQTQSPIQAHENILDLLLTPGEEFNSMPGQLMKKKRKRKRKNLGL